jgi:hypothetical protein
MTPISFLALFLRTPARVFHLFPPLRFNVGNVLFHKGERLRSAASVSMVFWLKLLKKVTA